jgi:hypothetical protein
MNSFYLYMDIEDYFTITHDNTYTSYNGAALHNFEKEIMLLVLLVISY